MFRTKVMGKTNQLFLNLPNGTFPFFPLLCIEALINFVQCGAAQKKLLGDKMFITHSPSLHSVTVFSQRATISFIARMVSGMSGLQVGTSESGADQADCGPNS